MKNLRLLLFLPAFSLLIFSSCSKDGATGPQGLQGAQGTQGNANVTPKSDSTNSASNWTFITGTGWYTDFVNPTLSNSFIQSGGFAEVFFSYDNGRVWTPLPVTYYADSALNAQMSYTYYTNTVQILFTWNDQKQHTDPVTTFASTCYFKVVCVAPAIVNSGQSHLPAGSNCETVLRVTQQNQWKQ